MRKVIFSLLMILVMTAGWVAAQDADQPILDEDARYIEVGGASIYLIERGDPDGLPVLLLHGFGGSVFTWRYTIDPLAEAGYRVIAFDRPPYGLSEKSSDFDWVGTAYADLTVGVMDELGIEAAVLVGHSAGGAVIADVAALYPERVLGLDFVAGAVMTGDPDIDSGRGQRDDSQEQGSGIGGLMANLGDIDPESPLAQIAVRTLLTPERFADLLTSAYYSPEAVPADAVEGYGRPLAVPGWEAAFLKLLSGGMGQPNYTPELWDTLDLPVFLQWGENDTWVPLVIGEAVAARVDGAILATYPETGHIPMEEQIDAFNADLLDWLAGIEG
ncbi:MAG: alpha/beta hydrolase [Anaerolineae bacterium]|jgi:pimeloyl-ACP methyl ester carboxylesterase|nr:alpha/beta hydrolase [Anaerolineae bacterium]